MSSIWQNRFNYLLCKTTHLWTRLHVDWTANCAKETVSRRDRERDTHSESGRRKKNANTQLPCQMRLCFYTRWFSLHNHYISGAEHTGPVRRREHWTRRRTEKQADSELKANGKYDSNSHTFRHSRFVRFSTDCLPATAGLKYLFLALSEHCVLFFVVVFHWPQDIHTQRCCRLYFGFSACLLARTLRPIHARLVFLHRRFYFSMIGHRFALWLGFFSSLTVCILWYLSSAAVCVRIWIFSYLRWQIYWIFSVICFAIRIALFFVSIHQFDLIDWLNWPLFDLCCFFSYSLPVKPNSLLPCLYVCLCQTDSLFCSFSTHTHNRSQRLFCLSETVCVITFLAFNSLVNFCTVFFFPTYSLSFTQVKTKNALTNIYMRSIL